MFSAIIDYLSAEWIRQTLIALYVFSALSTIVVILSENRNPVKSLAWVTVLIFLPLAGLVLYFFFGRNISNSHKLSRRNRRILKKREKPHTVDYSSLNLSAESLQQIRLAHTLSGASLYAGNDVEIFTNGVDKFARFKEDLRKAKSYINIQYYIFEDDEIGNEIAKILIDRAKNGVSVRVIYDHVGSFKVKRRFFKRMNEAGIETHPFFKVTFPPFGTRINWRNHRKVCIIDGKIGYMGGMNIADRYISGGKKFASWRDTHIRVCGPVVAGLQYTFAVDWHFVGEPILTDSTQHFEQMPGDVAAQLLTSGPSSRWTNIAFMFHKAIANAKQRIYLETPYFLPTDPLLKDLITASLAGVDVRIILPLRSDSRLLDFASASYITECLRAGIKIYFYTAGMMHSKTIIIDDEFATVGSTNFDFRSFEHNFEVNMFFYSRQFAQRMLQIFHEDIKQSDRVVTSTWRKRALWRRAVESVVRLFSPIL